MKEYITISSTGRETSCSAGACQGAGKLTEVCFIQGGGQGVGAYCWKTCSGEETGTEEQHLTSNDM